jgi:enoyl-CoA hydratase
MKLEVHGELAILVMRAGKGNAINLEMLDALDAALDAFDESAAPALVLTGVGTTFCVGLDLPAIVGADRQGVRAIMDRMHSVFLRIFRMPHPVVAAVNGHAIAGGCVLVQQADYRIMADGKFKTGLNETQLGVGLPAIVIESTRFHVPARALSCVALEGQLYSPAGACAVGLIDEVADDGAARALGKARELAAVPGAAYAHVKAGLRAPYIARAEAEHEAALERWLDTCFSDDARWRMGEVVARLTR